MSTENLGIEFHDSVLTILVVDPAVIVLELDAYVHHSSGVPGVDIGTGWIHRAEFRFNSAAVVQSAPALPAEIWCGSLRLGERTLENCVPAPVHYTGATRLDLTLASGGKLTIEASEISVALLGEGEYVEDFGPSSPGPVLFREFGPRTDTRYMTRAELFKSALLFLLGGTALSALLVAVSLFGFRASRTPGALVGGLLFCVALLTSAGFAGALYLAVRGIARNRAYDPSAVRRADNIRWAKRERAHKDRSAGAGK